MSSSTLQPSKQILNDSAFKSLDIQRLQSALLEIVQWISGEIQIAQITTNPTASQTDIDIFEPKNADEEWVVVGVSNQESAGVDNADSLKITYSDVITGNIANLRLGARTPYNGGTQLWPGPSGIAASEQYLEPTRELVLKLKNNGEAWKRLRVILATTATVGTRTHVAQLLYVARPRLNP